VSSVLVLVEGQTEERFVKDILAPFLTEHGVYVVPKVLVTKIVKTGANFKGGVTSFSHFERDLRLLLKDSSAKMVTTMIDLYGLPGDFPSVSKTRHLPYQERVAALTEALRRHFNDQRYRPYFSTHELEAILLPYPEVIAEATRGVVPTSSLAVSDPESVNFTNPPSKRIRASFGNYRKALHGPVKDSAVWRTAQRELPLLLQVVEVELLRFPEETT
jgi:hypothetical protein